MEAVSNPYHWTSAGSSLDHKSVIASVAVNQGNLTLYFTLDEARLFASQILDAVKECEAATLPTVVGETDVKIVSNI